MGIVLLVVLMLLPLPALADPPLTLTRVQQLAVESQPSLAALQAEVGAGRENAVAEGQLPDPRLKVGVQNVPTDSFALNEDPMTQTMVSVEQMIPGGDKRELRRRRTRAEVDRAGAELNAQRQLVRRDAGVAFVDLLGAARQLEIVKSLQQETQRQADAARIASIAGASAQADVLAMRRLASLSRDRESDLNMQREKARAGLARWIGPAATQPPEGALEMPPAPALVDLQTRVARHPAHAVAAGGVSVAEAELALAREAGKPDTTVELGYGWRARRFGDMVSIQFSIDLPLFAANRQDRGVAARQAGLERARAQQEDHLRMLLAELAASYAEWQAGRERLARYEGELLPDARARVAAALAAYGAGRGTLAAVLEARRDELEARLDQIELATRTARARLQLGYFEDIGDDHDEPR
jgi:outer membrane protein TolC